MTSIEKNIIALRAQQGELEIYDPERHRLNVRGDRIRHRRS